MATAEYCDLVMKGGITSGIVYPNAALALARRYRFKSIGGTSAGAIAAAACAAAALGERRRELGGAEAAASGFEGLRTVASELGRRGFISGLFQPSGAGRHSFVLVERLTAAPTAGGVAAAFVGAIARIAPLECAAALLALLGIAALVGGATGALAALVPSVLLALIAGAAGAVARTARAVRANSLGLCSGMRPDGRHGPPALTEWLHGTIQALAAQGPAPLTFDDLWTAPRYPDEPESEHALNLAVITTGISHHEPRSLPFERAAFWFRADEFATLFPDDVIAWMVGQDPVPVTIDGTIYHRLPPEGRLPVIVAARMSLSFPLLISAVPLHEGVRWSRDAAGEAARGSGTGASEDIARRSRPTAMRRCWFSDGGIASNFPIHLFDAALPRWPTFAIDLTYPDAGGAAEADAASATVFLPSENGQGWRQRHDEIAALGALREVGNFLFAVLGTMQNWRDTLQSRAPGHRDRIVHVALGPGEGGMNLDMRQEALDRIAAKGAEAGDALATRFDFANHWWVRWRNVASGTERFGTELARAVNAPATPSYAAALSSALTGDPAPPSYPFTADQQRDAQSRLASMVETGELWADADPDLTRRAPRPLPQLRMTPTY